MPAPAKSGRRPAAHRVSSRRTPSQHQPSAATGPRASRDALRVAVLCNRPLCGSCLRGLIENGLRGAEIRVAGTFSEMCAISRSDRPPHVIVYSAISPYSLDLDHVKKLCAKPVPVIVHLDMPEAALVRELFRAGVKGVLPTSMPPEIALAAIQLVVAGETYVPSRGVLESGSDAAAAARPATRLAARLTRRQIAVLRLTAEGMSNKEIGRTLGVAENTIKFHIAALMQKLGVNNRVRLAVTASRLMA